MLANYAVYGEEYGASGRSAQAYFVLEKLDAILVGELGESIVKQAGGEKEHNQNVSATNKGLRKSRSTAHKISALLGALRRQVIPQPAYSPLTPLVR